MTSQLAGMQLRADLRPTAAAAQQTYRRQQKSHAVKAMPNKVSNVCWSTPAHHRQMW